VVDPAIAGLNEGEKRRERAFLYPAPGIQILTEMRFYENPVQLVKPKIY